MELQIEKRTAAFFDEQGRLHQLPVKRAIRRLALTRLAEHFETGRKYTEKEVNALCDRWHTFGDYFAVRRCLVDEGLLARQRDGSVYWRVEQSGQDQLNQEGKY